MAHQEEYRQNFLSSSSDDNFDYSFVPWPARVAIYDDVKMPPRIIEVAPAPTQEFIESLAACINEHRSALGGSIPYSAIREVAENFIHAQFSEMVVSIYDGGNTIRFSDQGPGIEDKTHALLPGFTSANNSMKEYIRGVGSGFPQVKDYLDYSGGKISIEDNLGTGAVVTISLANNLPKQQTSALIPPLTPREHDALLFFKEEGAVGNKDLAEYLDIAASSANVVLKKLEEYGLIEKSYKAKRILTDLGSAVSQQI